jgi:hypothetical protein
MKALIIFLCLLADTCVVLHAQDSVLPKNVPIDERLNYNKYKPYVIPSINWLLQTPLNVNKEERRRLDNFVMAWLQKNEEVTVTMPDYLFKFQNVSNEMYFIYSAGCIKYLLQGGDTSKVNRVLAGVRTMLHYYSAGNNMKRSDYMDCLVNLETQGKLQQLYDTDSNATNSFLFLKTPAKNEFKADENYFNFHYTAINFLDPKALNCRYKLEGFYDDWVPTNDESIVFPKLPPGTYNFRLQASMLPDFRNAAEQSFSFTVISPIWKRPWFLSCIVLALFTMAYYYMSQREKGLKNMALLQQERMIFEYDHLRSQINPHFLFNSLNTLTELIEEQPQEAVKYSEHLSDLYRNMLAYRSEDLVYLSDELEILYNYMQIQQSRFGDSLQIKLRIPEDVQHERKIVPLALQLLVENAMKHNIASRLQPLVISISTDDSHITVANNIQHKLSKEKGLGLGLENIRKRYALATDKPISYGAEGTDYVVKLPLL